MRTVHVEADVLHITSKHTAVALIRFLRPYLKLQKDMSAIRVALVSLAAVALCLHGSAAQSTAGSSAAGASTISNSKSRLFVWTDMIWQTYNGVTCVVSASVDRQR